MTDKPTPAQIQRACDLANASNPAFVYTAIDYDDLRNHSFRALADTIAQLDAMQAERDKARADLGEIANKLGEVGADTHRLSNTSRAAIGAARDIAAPYRVETDPLVEALVAANARLCDSEEGYAPILRAELAKRGLEIGRSA